MTTSYIFDIESTDLSSPKGRILAISLMDIETSTPLFPIEQKLNRKVYIL